jgi:hypothetical protein
MPTLPTDLAPEALDEYHALARRHALPSDNVPAQWQAIASAKVLIEGLKSAGRDLTAARFVTALEGLRDFTTGLAAAVNFGPNRRVGLSMVRISRFDPATRQLKSAEAIQ